MSVYSATILADSPLAYWRLGESSGTAAADASGNSHGGTYGGTFTLGSTGLLASDGDTALSLAGAGYASGSALPTNSAGDAYSIEAWIKPTAASAIMAVFNKGEDGTSFGYGMMLYSGVHLRFRTSLTDSLIASNCITLNAINHVLVTADASQVKGYVNGVLAGTVSATTTADSRDLWAIGARVGLTSSELFTGTIDEVAIYASTLSAAQALKHYQAGLSRLTPGIVQAGSVPSDLDD